MINKTIHYIWLGKNKKPKSFEIAFKSWQQFCPNWDIIEWNEDNIQEFALPQIFFDLLNKKKYAFASDILRFYILKKYGGFYVDVDLIMVQDFNILLSNCELYNPDVILSQYHNKVNYYGTSCIGAKINNKLSDMIISYFNTDNTHTRMEKFVIINKVVSDFVNQELCEYKIFFNDYTLKLENNFNNNFFKDNNYNNDCSNILILEQEYFHPEIANKYTKNTFTYHLGNTSWIPWWKKIIYKLPLYFIIKRIVFLFLPSSLRNKIFKIDY